MDKLTIIYANTIDLLQPFKQKSTHWLPELNADVKPSYQSPEIICTTADTFLDLIKVLITNGQLPHDQIIYINIERPKINICYTFGPEGNVNDFFRL
jgi:hypothetical protein